MPEFGVTLHEMKAKCKGKNVITNRSTVVLDGNISLHDVEIDGSVWIKGHKTITNQKLNDKNYIEFCEAIDANEPAYIRIRGYKIANHTDLKVIS